MRFRPGTMRNVRIVLGALLGIMAIGFVANIQIIQDLIMDYAGISILILALSAFFLIRSGTGRQ